MVRIMRIVRMVRVGGSGEWWEWLVSWGHCMRPVVATMRWRWQVWDVCEGQGGREGRRRGGVSVLQVFPTAGRE